MLTAGGHAAAALHVQELRDAGAWSAYVARHPGALYHDLRWKELIETVFGHRCHYRLAMEGDVVRGVLPLVEMKSRLFGHFLVSLPFFNHAGILAGDLAAETALALDAARLAERLGARHVELRQTTPLGIPWTLRQHKVAMVVPLSEDPQPLWSALSSRMRGKVRKAGGNGAVFSLHGPERLADFYSVFAGNMRDLGTPVYSQRLFEAVFRSAPGRVHLFLVHVHGRPASAAIGLASSDGTLELPWICSTYESYGNEFLYWSIIEWACKEKFRILDLGRSSVGSGPYRFKKQWNPEERPLYWYYWTAPGVPVPQLNPENPKYRLAIRCWQKLPLPVVNLLGPRIVRYIP